MEGQGEGTNCNRRGRGEQGGDGETAILLTLFREWMRHQELETVWSSGHWGGGARPVAALRARSAGWWDSL